MKNVQKMWRNWCVGEGSGGREGGENVCMGEKCVWRRAKNVCGEGRKIIFFYCFGMVL